MAGDLENQNQEDLAEPDNPLVATTAQVAVAEPITIFHYEVLTVGDRTVARLTTQLLYVSFCLVVIAIINFIVDLNRSSLSLSSAIMNLLVNVSLPACGVIGVKDKNLTCIQYFCCCTYLCAFLTFIALISSIVFIARGESSYAVQLVLYLFFFIVYLKGGGLSQRLQEQPYFTQDRLAPHQTFNIHQNTVECNPQPTAQAEFLTTPHVVPIAPGSHLDAGAPVAVAAAVVLNPGPSPREADRRPEMTTNL